MGSTTTPIEIFRAGRHTAMSGAVLSFGEADLQGAAAAYDPAVHEAPLVVGHPKDNGPAYGWVRSLAVAGSTLQAEPHQVDEAFAELVRAGRFKKVSASFYTPDAPANPKPGSWYLRHVGFLGAQPPAVKGLKAVAFAEAEAGVVEFADWADLQNASLWRRLREFLIEQFGQDKADQVVPSYQVDTLQEDALREEPEPDSALRAFAEASLSTPPSSPPQRQESTMTQNTAAPAADPKAAAGQEAAFAEREQALAQREAALRRSELTQYLDGLVAAGRLPGGMKADVLAFAESVAGLQTTVEFGEGPSKQKLAPLDALKSLLGKLPTLVDFSERAPHQGGERGQAAGLTDKQIADRARSYKAEQEQAGNHISFAEAVDAVNAGLASTTHPATKER